MPQTIERPLFYEGQILGADDLAGLHEYARDQEARHARYAHTWGIAQGLELSTLAGNLEVAPGLAVDSSGAAIVMVEKLLVFGTELEQDISDPVNGTYPVFLVGRRKRIAGGGTVGRCGRHGQTREQEGGEVRFGREQDLAAWDKQAAPAIDRGPENGQQSSRLLLLGFVDWDKSTKKFANARPEYQPDNSSVAFRPRHMGVRADLVESLSGSIHLRTQPAGTRGAPLAILSQSGDEVFALGVDDSQGMLLRPALLVVKANGDVEIKGTVKSAPVSVGQMLLQSGTVTDGVRLPLPQGITDEDLTSNVAVHVMLNPRVDISPRPDNPAGWIGVMDRCRVDEERRVHCVVCWFKPGTGDKEFRPGVCDFLVVVTVPPAGGGGAA